MKDNPFTSDIFTTTWLKHFNNSGSGVSFEPLRKLLFVRHKIPKLYVNCGKNHTKGINYTVDNSNIQHLKGKALLIYDVPSYFKIVTQTKDKNLGIYRIKQYPGYLIDLDPFKDLVHYMLETFRKSSRYKLKKYQKRLETCFNIDYKMYYGNISKDTYDYIFNFFKTLLEKRFSHKQIRNNNLDPKEWNFYYDVAYQMILEKKASLFVVYNDDIPIGITLNYLSENILFDAITVFDIDYSKFHLGSVNIMKLIEWCLNNKIRTLDFSKGHFDYKERWSNKVYDFEYHIYYDSSSFVSRGIAFIVKNFFEFKQIMRDKKINEKLHKITFWLKNITVNKEKVIAYEFSEIEKDYNREQLKKVDIYELKNNPLKKIVFDFQYLKKESSEDIEVFNVINENTVYLIFGKTSRAKLQLFI